MPSNSRIAVRPSTENDIPLIQQWLEAGPYWQGEKITKDKLIGPSVDSVIFSDEEGPVLSIQFYKVVRAHVQFKPNARLRTARMLSKVVPKLLAVAKNSGFTEMVFSSPSKAVAAFFARFGFRERPDEHSLYL